MQQPEYLIIQILEKQAEINALVDQLKEVSPHLFKSQKKPSKRFPISHEIIESFVSAGIHAQCISEQTLKDFIEHRKAKKAPITKTVLTGFLREAGKAGISLEQAMIVSIERNWQGFKAEWYQQPVNKQSTNNTFFDSMNSHDF